MAKYYSVCINIFFFFFINHMVLTLQNQLQVGFYSETCPHAEYIVQSTIRKAFHNDSTVAPGLLRLQFHDCFVRGCDGSILLDGKGTEKQSLPNLSLHGLEVIDAAKSEVEAACPGVVSCADIIAFAARDSVVLTGGPSWEVPAGRRDGRASRKSDPLKFLPLPTAGVDELKRIFAVHGLSVEEMTTLSGAHTIGVSRCAAFRNRLYNFTNSSSDRIDPTLPPSLARTLQKLCPKHNNPSPNAAASLDSLSPSRFDNKYYSNLMAGRGLLTSDQALFTDSRTKPLVVHNSKHELQWQHKFKDAMIKLSVIEVKSEGEGEIRRHCRFVNSRYYK